jgi:hypothetical protein
MTESYTWNIDKGDKPKNVLMDVFDKIFIDYEPAKSILDAEMFLTTDELTHQLSCHYKGTFSDDQLFQILQDKGFQCQSFNTGRLQFVWLFKRRRNDVLSSAIDNP